MEQWINLTCALGLKKYADLNNSRLFRKISEDLRRFLKICEEFSTLFWSSYHMWYTDTIHRYDTQIRYEEEFSTLFWSSYHMWYTDTIHRYDTQIRYDTDANFFQKKKTSQHLTIFFPETVNTVNSLYSGHFRVLKLVSSVARVRNSRSLFQSNVCNFFCPEFICCPYYRGVRYSGVSARRELTVFKNWPI